ncbi:MAG TPA: DUF1579 family protein [Candidatus Acidoferrum sp.]|nr:DUF1579 family protein [Candidatus Acidoferrum sp.]
MNKVIRLSLVILTAAILIAALRAQSSQAPPKPGPQHEKLAFFVGKWTSEGDVKSTSYGPGGKYTATETCEWFPGKFAVSCKTDGAMMGGVIKGMSVMSYDTYQNSYIYFETNNWGENTYAHGVVDADTWTWTNDSPMNGKTVHGRFTMKQLSPDAAAYKFEMATGSDPMTLVMEGKQTRQK